jgi:hypothetical protein
MTNLSETFMPVRPTELAVTIRDADDDVFDYLVYGGVAPDMDGYVLLLVTDGHTLVPLKGLYRLRVITEGVIVRSPGLLVTAEQFKHDFAVFDEPYYEYGVKFLPRRNDVVVRGSLEVATGALDALPVLKASGDHGVVRRLVHEPGDWERVERLST